MERDEFEGRLSAQREILISLLAAVLSGNNGPLEQLMRDEEIFMNGQEDPGVLPTEAFALESARAEEIRTILTAARARAEAIRSEG
jgi:hypothetical protein